MVLGAFQFAQHRIQPFHNEQENYTEVRMYCHDEALAGAANVMVLARASDVCFTIAHASIAQ